MKYSDLHKKAMFAKLNPYWGWGLVPKIVFAMNCLKYPDLHGKSCLPIPMRVDYWSNSKKMSRERGLGNMTSVQMWIFYSFLGENFLALAPLPPPPMGWRVFKMTFYAHLEILFNFYQNSLWEELAPTSTLWMDGWERWLCKSGNFIELLAKKISLKNWPKPQP